MSEMDDMALLREYATSQSETAFTTLVERHIGLVYCAALRQTRDPALAQEITQVVFILLARKARTLGRGTILSAWLYRAARFAASDARKMAFRRQQREQEAFQMQTISPASSDESAWEQIAPLLDEAMAALAEKDRNAVMLRFFEQKSLEEVGVALGIGTVTAQKRVWRAVDKLRQYFSRHGATLSGGAITATLSAHAIHGAPSGLAATVAACAALKGAAVTASTATLLKTTLKLMAWTKLRTASAVGVAALLAVGTSITIMKVKTPPDLSWEIPNAGVDIFSTARPQTTIVPTKFKSDPNAVLHWVWDPDGRCMGTKITLEKIIKVANNPEFSGDLYHSNIRTQVVVPLPEDEYDFYCNLPQGASNALRHEIESKFGVTYSHKMVQTNVLVLSPRRSTADATKPAPLKSAQNAMTMTYFTKVVESAFNVPVIDQTGLTGKIVFDFDWKGDHPGSTNTEALRQALLDQLGLALTPQVQPIEMLVIEKAK